MIESVIPVREITLVGDLKVKRILPYRERRMVGPFAFLDEMGPITLSPGAGGDVPPHPHIGLSTVTYLHEGELDHRDSLDTTQKIVPGDVNWMTAGRGIVHSERIPAHLRNGTNRLHGLQAWVALPLAAEEAPPAFSHYSRNEIPTFEINGVRISLVAGSAFGYTSPVEVHSKLFYFDARMPDGSVLEYDSRGQESAFYLLSGQVEVDQRVFEAPTMLVFKTGIVPVIRAKRLSRGMFLGGEPLEGPRHIWWNFVASSKERLERAKQDWKEQRFPMIPGETEFVPLPGDTQPKERSTFP